MVKFIVIFIFITTTQSSIFCYFELIPYLLLVNVYLSLTDTQVKFLILLNLMN